MRRVVALALAAGLTLGLAACADDGGEDPQYARVCVDRQTHERVDGNRCGDDQVLNSGFIYWYLLYGRALPAYGQPVVGGYSRVSGSSVVQRAETAGAGRAYTKAQTHSYSTGSGKNLGTTSGGSGYKAPAPKAPAPAVKPGAPAPKAPAPVYKAPAPVVRPPAPPVRFK